jgi:very-short-patch-repair endonuclease
LAGGLGPFEADVAARLAEFGITVAPQYGVGGYRVDFAVAHPDDPARMILAVEADGTSYRDSGSVRDRDRLRKEHLERLGWRVHRLWSTSWFTDPETELAKLRAAYTEAVRANPVATPEPADVSAEPADVSAESPAPDGPPGPVPSADVGPASLVASKPAAITPAVPPNLPASRDS